MATILLTASSFTISVFPAFQYVPGLVRILREPLVLKVGVWLPLTASPQTVNVPHTYGAGVQLG
jgi:hypothetical protein